MGRECITTTTAEGVLYSLTLHNQTGVLDMVAELVRYGARIVAPIGAANPGNGQVRFVFIHFDSVIIRCGQQQWSTILGPIKAEWSGPLLCGATNLKFSSSMLRLGVNVVTKFGCHRVITTVPRRPCTREKKNGDDTKQRQHDARPLDNGHNNNKQTMPEYSRLHKSIPGDSQAE